MTIKAFAFKVQSMLRDSHGTSIKRSHVHEVLAALFGYASYAALTNQRLLAQHDGSLPVLALDVSQAANRAVELGYIPPGPPLIASVVASAVEAEKVYAVPLEVVLVQLDVEFDDEGCTVPDVDSSDPGLERVREVEGTGEDDDDDDGMFFCLDTTSPFLHESLLRMAESGSAAAHLALARMYEETLTEMDDAGTSPNGADGRFWYQEQRSGRVLSGVEAEWADAYGRKHKALHLRGEHLRRATMLGSAEAALRQSEIDPTDENFDLAASRAGIQQAARLAEIAMFLGRDTDALPPLRALAMRGDTVAMRELASSLEPDLKQAWTWVYLAKLLGVDVMAHYAVGDDGLPADADEAGPIYAAGGFHLEKLPDAEDAEALVAARKIHAKLIDNSSSPY